MENIELNNDEIDLTYKSLCLLRSDEREKLFDDLSGRKHIEIDQYSKIEDIVEKIDRILDKIEKFKNI